MMAPMDQTGEHTLPPAGWYPDPSGQPVWRWWTGEQWSGYASAMGAPTPPAGLPQSPSALLLQAGQARLDGFVAAAVWIYVVIGTAATLVNWASIGYYRALWHWLHLVLHAASLGQTAPMQPARPLWSQLFSAVSLGAVAVEVIFLVWQYRSARVAQALGYPARHSPGWGVGCWFVPVVNLWMPYQAVRDCLPPGHVHRRRVLYAWLLFLSAGLVGPATLVVLVVDRPAGIALFTAYLGLELALGFNAYRVVQAIAGDHRRAVAAPDPSRIGLGTPPN
ncbi:MAG: DUF4328 domain-containing protein [Acidimicrobiales bacterium]